MIAEHLLTMVYKGEFRKLERVLPQLSTEQRFHILVEIGDYERARRVSDNPLFRFEIDYLQGNTTALSYTKENSIYVFYLQGLVKRDPTYFVPLAEQHPTVRAHIIYPEMIDLTYTNHYLEMYKKVIKGETSGTIHLAILQMDDSDFKSHFILKENVDLGVPENNTITQHYIRGRIALLNFRVSRAIDLCSAIHPDEPLNNLLQSLISISLNDMDSARKLVDETLKEYPYLKEAQRIYDIINSQATYAPMITMNKTLNEISRQFYKASVLEQQGNYEEAWETYITANEKAKRFHQARYNRDFAEKLFRETISRSRVYPKKQLPVLCIVGMPRSGTTLIEQILGAHLNTFPAGELSANSSELTQYIRAARGKMVITKAPFDFWVIDRIIEKTNAKIIYMLRHPLDLIVSNIRQNFRYPQGLLACSLNPDDCLHQINLCFQLSKVWKSRYPANVKIILYEQLVQNPERTVQRILSWCGLEGDANYLLENYQQLDRVVRTASIKQVREPVTTKYIGIWRNYRFALDKYTHECTYPTYQLKG